MASKPAILAVDDDPDVLRAVERDLRKRYADRYRVVRADSGPVALGVLRQLKDRGEPVGLMLVDQRMPGMSGIELLGQSVGLHADVKRVLLTAYADTDAAIRAINEVRLDHYLMKPWDPPEERLYPVLDDLLADWQAAYRPPFDGIRVVGNRWSPRTHDVKDFLARHQVPYRWLDVEQEPEARRLIGIDGDALPSAEAASNLPLVIFQDGTRLKCPTTPEVAAKIGMHIKAERPFYDLTIIGSGPAGLAAAVYGASEGLRTLMIEREAPGGQAGQSSRIENYLGFPVGLSGVDLARRGVTQAKRLGAEILSPQEVTGVRADPRSPYRVVTLADGTEVGSHVLMVASGMAWKRLDVPGLADFAGAGVYYGAAMSEAVSCRDDDVFVVGGANSAGQAAVYFAKFARRVTMLVRDPAGLGKGMSAYLVEQIRQTPNVVVRAGASVAGARGDGHLAEIDIADCTTGATETVPATALFVFIGAVPHTGFLQGLVELDADGYVLTGVDLLRDGKRPKAWPLDRDPFPLETSVPGVLAAGDCRHGSMKRVAAAVGDGGVAVSITHRYLRFLGAVGTAVPAGA